jgi:hypothetical protein
MHVIIHTVFFLAAALQVQVSELMHSFTHYHHTYKLTHAHISVQARPTLIQLWWNFYGGLIIICLNCSKNFILIEV